MTLLEIVQAAAMELGLSPPAAVVSSTDDMALQFYALAQRMGSILESSVDWSALTKLHVINLVAPLTTTGNVTSGSAVITNIPNTSAITPATYFTVSGQGIQQGARVLSVDSATQVTMNVPATGTYTGTSLVFAQDTYALPSDWSTPVARTQWDRTSHWELHGAVTAQQYQWLVSGITSTGPRRKYRVHGRTVVIWPPPSSADTPSTLAMEYVSSYWARSASGVEQPRFQADTDTTVFPDELMIMGLKWLFFQAKGFEYTELRRQWSQVLARYAATEQGQQTLSMSGRPGSVLISPANVPDADWPG